MACNSCGSSGPVRVQRITKTSRRVVKKTATLGSRRLVAKPTSINKSDVDKYRA